LPQDRWPASSLGHARPGAAGDRLAVCVAALGVLRAAARCRPVLAIIDDVQWVDVSSRECIEYIARRADGPLAVVLAARDPLYPPERIRLPELPVGPVDDATAAELLRHRAPGLAPPVVAAISELETVERLTEGSGHEEPVIVPWVQDLVEAYARQGRRDDARRVLAGLERQAASTAIPVVAAAAARCRCRSCTAGT
jgi:hypothetical protein